jgi:hypothetical protein
VTQSLMQRYKGSTSLQDPSLPRPLPVAYVLAVLNVFSDPASLPALRLAMLDNSQPSAPGVRAAALDGLLVLRDQLNQQAWAPVVADVQKLAADERNPVVLLRIYRLLAADQPEARATEGTTLMLRILESRLNRFEKEGVIPSIAEREAAAWLGARAAASQNAAQVNAITLQLGRLLADAAHLVVDPATPAPRKETLERIVLAAEQALVAIADAKAQGRPKPNVTGALLAPGADHAKRIADEVNKWIGTSGAAGFLNVAPFNLPAGLNIQRAKPVATATATAAA